MRRAILLLYALFNCAALFSVVQSAIENRYAGIVTTLFCLSFSLAIWIGPDRLGHIEIRLANQMLYNGTFGRRLLYTRLSISEMKRLIASAPSLYACWLAISRVSRLLGFSFVSVRINDAVYCEGDEPVCGECWELSIPLSGSDCIQLGHGFDAHTQDFVSTVFVHALRETMLANLRELQSPGYEAGRGRLAIPSQPAWSAQGEG
jgi:hypothetical protein